MKTLRAFWAGVVLLTMGISACGSNSPLAPILQALPARPTVTRTPFQPIPPTPVPPSPTIPPPTPSATSPPGIPIWVDPGLPEALRSAIRLPVEIIPAAGSEGAALRLQAGGEHPVSQWVYAVVAPFPTLEDGVSSKALRNSWGGSPSGPFSGRPILLDESTRTVFSALWGAPVEGAVRVLPGEELLDYAWEHRPAWALIPFEVISPRWKTLEVDGLSPLRKEFDPAAYSLTVPVALQGDPALVELLMSLYGPASGAPLIPPGNRDPNKLSVVAMTGVTALVRATAFTMEQRGIEYPARDIGEWLRSADITHISNEVPFAKQCPSPNPVQQGMRFCSDTRYIGLLEAVGTDIVELTGDHFADWGEEAMLYTLELYKERGWLYYGGGEDLQDGRKPVTLEHNGNRLAFIGCNGKGGSFAQAAKNHPGAVPCDFETMESEIARLRDEGYLGIATFQHFEYYTYQAQPDQERDFRRLAQAGAVVVSGSQAHQPQAFEFESGALIHYGLGNLFFDQFDVSPATRQAFIDRHIFYDGRYLGSELLTMMFVDYARPRPMTAGEREDLLQTVFKASGW
jgi:poly-gamma-glutamate synthesis protein (capsule biosynthesis protein)